MTGYTVHTGSNEKFAAGWDQIFSGGKTARKGAESRAQKRGAGKPANAARGAKPSRKVKRGK